MTKPKVPPRRYPVTPLQESTDHHYKCPICGHMVDELDLQEVMAHIDPDHEAPTKN